MRCKPPLWRHGFVWRSGSACTATNFSTSAGDMQKEEDVASIAHESSMGTPARHRRASKLPTPGSPALHQRVSAATPLPSGGSSTHHDGCVLLP